MNPGAVRRILEGKEGDPAKIIHKKVCYQGIYVGKRPLFEDEYFFAWRNPPNIERLKVSSYDMGLVLKIKDDMIVVKHRLGNHITIWEDPRRSDLGIYASSIEQAEDTYNDLSAMLNKALGKPK